MNLATGVADACLACTKDYMQLMIIINIVISHVNICFLTEQLFTNIDHGIFMNTCFVSNEDTVSVSVVVKPVDP